MRIPTALRGAAAQAALAATEKMLPDAQQACRIAQAALDSALESGRDTAPFRQALQQAQQQAQAINSAIREKYAQLEQRRQDKLNAAAAGLIAAGNETINRLLQAYQFDLNSESPQ